MVLPLCIEHTKTSDSLTEWLLLSNDIAQMASLRRKPMMYFESMVLWTSINAT